MTEHADVLFVADGAGWGADGSIWTGTGSRCTAVAVVGGRIVALDREALDRRGPATEVVDLAGRTLLPGFRDGHLHPLAGGVESLDCDLVDAVDVAEVLARLRAYAAAHPDVPWVLGYGYPPELLPGGVGQAALLDGVVGDRPVALWSSDHHMVWCNSEALAVAGITAGTADPPRGSIVRDAQGDPVGTLLEEAELLLEDHLPPRGTAKEARGLEVGLARMAAAGLVWGQDAWTQLPTLPAYQVVADAGRLTADLDLACKVEVDGWRGQVAAFADARRDAEVAARRRAHDGMPGGRLSVTTVKFFVDGVIEGGTAAMLEPYEPFGDRAASGAADGCGHRAGDVHGDDRGIANWTLDELVAAAAAMDAAGFQLHLHAIGDAAIRLALDAIEQVAARNGPRDRRPTIAHTHLVHPDDLPRFRALGVVANLEPLWAQRNAIMVDLTEPRLGPERTRWQYPIGSLVRSGAAVSFGSDWPVSSHVPLEGVAVAVTRRGSSGPAAKEPFLPEQAVTLDQALAAYTTGTAYQAGDEAEAGRIAVGQRADLALVAGDLASMPPDDLRDVPVAGTWVAGRQVHRAE
jgi:predicted amidohydrolase YtcJ